MSNMAKSTEKKKPAKSKTPPPPAKKAVPAKATKLLVSPLGKKLLVSPAGKSLRVSLAGKSLRVSLAGKSLRVSLAGKKLFAGLPSGKVASQEEPKRQRRSPEVARGHILEVAKKLLAEHGPDAIGLKAVAESAGVSHSLISHYFGTYDALVEEALHAHLADLREETLKRVASLVHAGPMEWIDASFDQFAGPVAGRLLAWAILSGRLDKEDFFPRRDQGMKRVADAIQARLTGELREEAPTREDIEFAMLVNFSTGLGYSVARQVLWGSFNKEASVERDRWFRTRFAELLTASLPSVDSLVKKTKAKRGNTP